MTALHALQLQASALRPMPTEVTEAKEAIEHSARIQLRSLLREFLRTVPADEPDAILDLPMPDGRILRVSRGALTRRIQWLRPRARRIVERQIIGHVDRGQVARELGVCLKTLERDQVEALDILLSEAGALVPTPGE